MRGSAEIGGETVTCTAAHGEQTIQDALANSCNVAFGQLAGGAGDWHPGEIRRKGRAYQSYDVSGIPTAAGSVDLSGASDNDLAWAGVGQYHDSVNPCA